VASSLVVRNRSVFDVNVYSLSSPAAAPVRLGTVVGASTATFPLHARDLAAGGVLVVRLHAIGSNRSWTSPGVSVGAGLMAILDVNTDPFGDCSSSSLHTIVTSDSGPPGIADQSSLGAFLAHDTVVKTPPELQGIPYRPHRPPRAH
jgi:hypothetical protein